MSDHQYTWADLPNELVDTDSMASNNFNDRRHWAQIPSPYEKHILYNQGIINVAASAPPRFNPRQPSPTDQMSTSYSSDSEYGMDYPATPPDNIALSPYTVPYDHWVPQGITLAGLANTVKPQEVSFYPHGYSHPEEPEFLSRGNSMSSNDSSYDCNSMAHLESMHIPRSTTPAGMALNIKPELCAATVYPPLGEDDDDMQIPVQPSQDIAQTDDDKDEDYTPGPTSKRTASKAGKRSSSLMSAPPLKKVKRESYFTAAQPPSKIAPIAKGSFHCNECRDAIFKDQNALQKHIKQQHTRPFICVFHFAGCDSTFASKNEWKRHVASQHLLLNYWLCRQDACAKLSNSSGSSTHAAGAPRHRSSTRCQANPGYSANLPSGAIFNRKDLYTQHIRRMHVPLTVKRQVKAKKKVPEWEERIRVCQEDAHRLRCELPQHMTCPVSNCEFQANGPMAWDERMEHVAKHLEKAANGLEPAVAFGGFHDPTLMDWVLRPDVAVIKVTADNKFALNNPLKPDRTMKSSTSTSASAMTPCNDLGEEDAPGEEVEL